MADFSNIQTPSSLTTHFTPVLSPLFRTEELYRYPTGVSASVRRIGQMALNVYCPGEQTAEYEHLLCQEMARKRYDYDTRQPVKSLWFLGQPLQQLSPAALTELCFRFGNHFPHNDELNTVRGIAVTPSELNRDSLALFSGLKFNCVEMYVDASVASSNRSLDKVTASLQMLADYGRIKLNCKIRFSDHSAADFMTRLLDLLESAQCQQIELSCTPADRPVSLSEIQLYRQQLLSANKYFADRGWLTCGNNCFYAPGHENHALHQQRKLRLTPWGFQSSQIQTWLGLGVGAMSGSSGIYERNTTVALDYQQAIALERPVAITQYQLKTADAADDDTVLRDALQDMLCYHRLSVGAGPLRALLAPVLAQGWLTAEDDALQLTDIGVINLSAICHFLLSLPNTDIYNRRNP